MKIGKIKEFYNLILENIKDGNLYTKYHQNITTNKNVNMLMGFNSQNQRTTFTDYLNHEFKTASSETKLLAWKLDNIETDKSIVEICAMFDELIYNKNKTILNNLKEGKIIRINQNGGYCFIDNLDEYEELFDINDKELVNFLTTGNFNEPEINLDCETLIIENDPTVSVYLKDAISDYSLNDVVEFTNFRNKLIAYTDIDIFNLFNNAIKNKLKNICFETTGQDMNQIMNMIGILKKINLPINLYILSYDDDVRTVFLRLSQEFTNIKIEIL